MKMNGKSSVRPGFRRRGLGYTLAELMVALSIFAFSSTAIASLMYATYNTNRHVKGMTEASDASEITLRRIIEVMRSAVDVSYTNASTGLFVETPPDSSNLSFIYVYYTQTSASGKLQLHEKIQNASTLAEIQNTVIVDDISSFTVARQGTSFPESYVVSLTLNATPVQINRTVTITCRNITQ
jgi:type II secretory pathway pseudopilin PulG